jgi:hypothetical protein
MTKENAAPDPGPSGRTRRLRRSLPVITENRKFVGLVLLVSRAGLLSFLGLCTLAVTASEPPTRMQSELASACQHTLSVTVGALVGLLGGRAAAPDRMEVSEAK